MSYKNDKDDKDDFLESENEDFCYKFGIPFYLKVSNVYDKIIKILSEIDESNIRILSNELKNVNIDNSFFEEFKNFIKDRTDKNYLDLFEEYFNENYETKEEFDKDFGGTYTIGEINNPDDIIDDMEESFDFENFVDYFDYFSINSIKIMDYTEDSFIIEVCTSSELDEDQMSDVRMFIEDQCKGDWGNRYRETEVYGCTIYVYWLKGEFEKKYNISYIEMTGPVDSDSNVDDMDDYVNSYYDDDRY